MSEYVLACAILGAASFLQGAAGFGSAMLAVPLLSLFLPIKVVAPLFMLNAVAFTVLMALKLKQDMNSDALVLILVGALPGVAAGVLVLKHMPDAALKTVVGAMLLGYGMWALWCRPVPLGLGRKWGLPAGFLGGAMSSASAIGGPPVIVYTTLTDWNSSKIKATLAGYFALVNIMAAAAHAAAGLVTGRVLLLLAASLPVVVPATVAGIRVSSRLGEAGYRRFMYMVLAAMGALLIIKA